MNPPKRLSADWFPYVGKTGRLFESKYWRDPRYLEVSPWPKEELDKAFSALEKLYPPKDVIRIFSEDAPYLRKLLYDFVSPWFSVLVGLGFDLAVAQPWEYRELIHRLKKESQFDGARFELSVWAAFIRAGIGIIYEPFRKQGSVNPDFKIRIGNGLILDVKHPQTSYDSQKEQELFEKIVGVGVTAFSTPSIPAKVELTEGFREKLRDDDGCRWLFENASRIQEAVREKKVQLSSSSSFPAVEIVEGLVKIEVMGPVGSSGASAYIGVKPDFVGEARRIVRGCLQSGASQIPSDHLGAILVKAEWNTTIEIVEKEVIRWFDQEGEAYDNIIGAILIGWGSGIGSVVPERIINVWRPQAPPSYKNADIWGRFCDGLNWRNLNVIEWERTYKGKPKGAGGPQEGA